MQFDAGIDQIRHQERLTAAVRARKLKVLKQRIYAELFAKADVEYVNPILKSQAEKADRGIRP